MQHDVESGGPLPVPRRACGIGVASSLTGHIRGVPPLPPNPKSGFPPYPASPTKEPSSSPHGHSTLYLSSPSAPRPTMLPAAHQSARLVGDDRPQQASAQSTRESGHRVLLALRSTHNLLGLSRPHHDPVRLWPQNTDFLRFFSFPISIRPQSTKIPPYIQFLSRHFDPKRS